MKGKLTKSFLALALTATVTIGNLGITIALAESNNMISGASIEELLNNFPENSKKFLDVTAGSKLKLDEGVDLNSNDKVEVIVELKSDPNAAQRTKALKEKSYTKVDIDAEHEAFKNSFPQTFSNEDSSVEFGFEFKEVFNGIVLTVPANEIEKIAEMGAVKTIWSNRVVQLDLPENQTKESAADEPSLLMHDSLPGIGADKLHDENIKGEGIKVGVLDTGVDYNHPDLKDAFKGGYDFVDNDGDPMETTYEDWKNSNKSEFNSNGDSYYTSHGTHVSGTILGRGENEGLDYAITGVAPKADLYSYRVLGPYGSGSIDGIIAAIEESVEEGMDVINLSLGIGINDPYRPEAIAINNCMLYTNTVAVVAASNDGPSPLTLGSPGTASLGITVGANTSAMPRDTMDLVYGEKEYHLDTFAKTWTDNATDLLDKEYEIVHVGLGSTEELEGKDLNGKIALISRGTLTFVDKIANVKAAGAVGAIIYNNVEGPLNIYLGESDSFIRTFAMDQASGQALINDLSSGETQKISFANYEEIKTESDVLADFSSRGPVSGTIHIKPEVTAPGVDILSTVPGYINDKDDYDNYDISYGRMSGTSMATPHVAGIVALMKEEHPDYTPQDVKSILMNTSEELNGDYSVFEVGAGIVNAFEAVKTDVNIQVMDTAQSVDEEGEYIDIQDVTGDLSFGKIEKGVTIEKNLQILINSEEDKDFTIRTEFTTSNYKPVENPAGENVTLNIPETFHAKAGVVNKLKFSINVPETSANGTYEGYVILTSGEKEYRLPFAALAAGTYIMVENLNDMISLGEFHPYQAAPYIYTGFEVSEQFEQLDVLILDGETNEYVGYIGSLLTDILPINTYLEVGPLVGYGYYCPIFTDSNGNYYLDTNAQKLSEDKRYVIQFRAVDKKGELITGEDDYFVDSVGPKLTFEEDTKPGIYEIEYDPNNPEEIFYIDGNVYDDYVDYAKSFGYEISQASNGVGFLENMPSSWNQGVLSLTNDGKLHAGYPTAQVNEEGVIRLSVYPIDYASSGNYRTGLENFIFVRKGMSYLSFTGEARDLKVGDKTTLTFSGRNLQDYTLGSFQADTETLESGETIYDIIGVTPTPELEAFLKVNNMELEIEYSEPEIDLGISTVMVDCSLKGDNIVGINGDMPLLNFEVQVKNESDTAMSQIMKLGRANGWMIEEKISYINTSGQEVELDVLNANKGIIKSTTTKGYGSVVPQGATDEFGYLNTSLSELGTTVIVTAPDGSKYSADLDNPEEGYYTLKDLPVQDGVYSVEANTPGHLAEIQENKVTYNYNGDLFGANSSLFQINQFAGDVNGDGVIDIIDAILIARAIGANAPEIEGLYRDLNSDGFIGELDLDYVVENFNIAAVLKEGVGRPVLEFDGMTLEEVVEKVGTMYEKKGPEISINLEDGKVYNSQVNLEVSSKDYIYSSHKVYVNGEEFQGSNLYEDGKYEIKVVATDDLGNTSEKVINIKIKTVGPKVTISGVEDGKVYEGSVKPVITTEKDTENTITLNDKSYNGEEITAEGKYVLKVVSKDDAGNATTVTISFEIKHKAVDPNPGDPTDPKPEDPKPEKPEKPSKPGTGLPQTGSIVGSTLLVLAGVAVVAIGAFGLIKKKSDKSTGDNNQDKGKNEE